MARDYGSEREVCQSVGGGGGRRLTNDWRAISRPTRRLQRHDSIPVGHGQIITRDVSCTSFDVHEDDSYTGRARVAASAGLASAALQPDMRQDYQITFPHTRPSRAIGRSTPRPFMETSTRSTTYQIDRPTPPR